MTKTAPKEGFFYGQPFEQYLAIDAANSSTIKWGRKSCLHMEAAQEGRLDNDTAAKKMGRHLHSAIFEPASFKRIPVSPFKDFRTQEAQLWRDATPTYLTETDLVHINAVSANVRKHPQAKKLLAQEGGKGEVTVVAKDPETGLFLKARIDFLAQAIVEGKSTVDASCHAHGFPKQAAIYGYHLQQAFYQRVLKAADYKYTGFIFLCFEKSEPYCVTTQELDDISLQKGEAEVSELLELYKGCKESGHWPGYSDKLEIITLPKWRLQESLFESSLGYELEEAY